MPISLYSSPMKYKDPNTGQYETINGISGKGIVNVVLNNDYTLSISFSDNTSITTAPIRGATGNGISSIEKTATSGLTDTYTITYTDGETSSFIINNGAVPTFSIGTVTEGTVAAATITGTATNPVLNLTLPNADVPTKVSELTNDAGYLTAEIDPTVPAWAKAANKPTYTAAEIGAPTVQEMNEAIAQINGMNIHICAQGEYNIDGVPTIQNPDTQTFYLIPSGEGNDMFAEWIYTNNKWEIFGGARVDLSDYALKSELPTKVSELSNDAGYLTSHQDISGKANSADLATVATSGDYDDLINKPTIPTVPVQSVNSQTGAVVLDAQDIGAYEKPVTGIPKTDLASDIQTSLGKADTALQSAPVASVNTKTGAVVLTPSDIGAGTYSKPSGGIPASDLAAGVIPEVPVQDVQVNDASILNAQGVANIPIATSNDMLGLVKPNTSYGIGVLSDGTIGIVAATNNYIKAGSDNRTAITPGREHAAAFYGLAKAAGDSTQAASSNSVGTYTDDAKAAIQQMLDVPSTDDIPTVPVQDVQINGVSVLSDGIANVPLATASSVGVIRTSTDRGTQIYSQTILGVSAATTANVKDGSNSYRPIVPGHQHESTFYGLAKVAGHDEKNSTEPVGTYTPEAKGAIQSMLGISDLIATTENSLVASRAYAIGDIFTANGKLYKATAAIAVNDTIVLQNSGETISGSNAEEIKLSDYAVHDVQLNGSSIIQGGVANVPLAGSGSNAFGVVKFSTAPEGSGVTIDMYENVVILSASASTIKAGTNSRAPIAANNLGTAIYYGLSKLAGQDLKNDTVTVGTYPEKSLSAISEMLNAPVSVSGSTPSIVAKAGVRYVCGEVMSLDFTPSATGICDVVFTSGSTPTVLTVPNTVKWPEWFVVTGVEPNRTYEINILNGVYGAVMSWS